MLKSATKSLSFSKDNQNFWQLAAIQIGSMGFPLFIIGGQLSKIFDPGTALCSIVIGNLILWLIGLAVIGMTNYGSNGIENVGFYLGNGGKYAFAFAIGLTFIGWFIIQSRDPVTIIADYFDLEEKQSIRIGAIFGILTAIVSMGGIRLIKYICILTVPVLFSYFWIAIYKMDFENGLSFQWGLSIFGILSAIFVILPGLVNIPTFFRHSKSKAHSFLALTIMVMFYSIFESFSIFLRLDNIGQVLKIEVFPFISIIVVVIAALSVNLVNIYFASAIWEVVARRGADARDYAVIGLIGTGGYALLQSFPIMRFLENMINGFIASIFVVLVSVFLIRLIASHRPRKLERFISNSCWFIGSVASLFTLIHNPNDPNAAILVGVGSSALSFLVVIFIEETVWAFKRSSLSRGSKSQ